MALPKELELFTYPAILIFRLILLQVKEKMRNCNVAGLKEIQVDSCGDEEAAGEGASLANWKYDRFKADKKPRPVLLPLEPAAASPGWTSGIR